MALLATGHAQRLPTKMTGTDDILLSSCPGLPPRRELEASMDLLGRAQAGDRAALGELVRRHQEQLLRVVRIRLGPGMRRFLESGDIVQETYQALLQGIERLELQDGNELLQWLTRVATNRIRDQHDRAHALMRDPGREEPPPPESASSGDVADLLAADATRPSEGAMRNEVREVLDAAIAELSPEYREAIVLRDYCGAPWEEIARALGRESIHAAQQLHQRAWIKVRKLAEPRLGGARGGSG